MRHRSGVDAASSRVTPGEGRGRSRRYFRTVTRRSCRPPGSRPEWCSEPRWPSSHCRAGRPRTAGLAGTAPDPAPPRRGVHPACRPQDRAPRALRTAALDPNRRAWSRSAIRPRRPGEGHTDRAANPLRQHPAWSRRVLIALGLAEHNETRVALGLGTGMLAIIVAAGLVLSGYWLAKVLIARQ